MQTDISDNMMARTLCGMASPHDEAAVLDHISASDEHLADWLAMAAAVERFGSGTRKATRRRTRPLWTVVAVAASAALLLGVGLMLRLGGGTQGFAPRIDTAPPYAAQDTIATTKMEDSLL